MAGPLAGMMGQMGGLMLGQVGQAFGRLAGKVLTGTEVGLPLAADGTAVLVPQNVRGVGLGPRPAQRRGPPLPGPARGRLAAAVARAVAAPAAARRRARLRPRHRRQPRGHRARHHRGDGLRGHRPRRPRGLQRLLPMLKPERRPAADGPAPAGDAARAGGAGWTPSSPPPPASGCPGTAPCRDDAPPPALRRPGRATFAALVGLQLRPRRLRTRRPSGRDGPAARHAERDRLWSHPRPAADVGGPRRAAGLRRPAGHPMDDELRGLTDEQLGHGSGAEAAAPTRLRASRRRPRR